MNEKNVSQLENIQVAAPCNVSQLENIQVAAPCKADWDQMSGDDRVRHCQLCRKNVYNLSSMTRAEAEALIKEKEGCCVRFYRRADGTMLTDNCPVGVRALRRRLRWMATGIAALFTFGLVYAAKASVANGSFSIRTLKPISSLQDTQPFKQLIDWIDPPQSHAIVGMMIVKTPQSTKN